MRAGAVAGGAGGALILGLLLFLPLSGDSPDAQAATCTLDGPSVPGLDADDPRLADLTDVAGYSGEQLVNAAIIVSVGHERGLSVRDQSIAVMTAMGESGLVVLDHGDAVGPDSRGLFQQRDNGAWGTYEDRMDPARSSASFYDVLETVTGREDMDPSLVAHTVQRNADPFHYTRYWPDAQEVVQAVAGANLAELEGLTAQHCTTTAGELSTDGWTHPLGTYDASLSSVFGVPRYGSTHAGIDLAAPDGTPIYAVADGVVTIAGTSTGGNTGYMVAIDHGGGVQSRYVHSWADGIHVTVGQQVTAGTHIADVGSSGNSSGPHLHFEFRIDGTPVEPIAYLAERGIEIP